MNYSDIYSNWIYHNKDEIDEFIQKENISSRPIEHQKHILLRQLNFCMFSILLTHCKGYKMKVKKIDRNDFIDIDQISKRDEIIFDSEEWLQTAVLQNQPTSLPYRRKFQMKIMIQLIWQESNIQMIFNDNDADFQLICLLDENNQLMNLLSFLDKYGNFDTFNDFIEKKLVSKTEQNNVNSFNSIQFHLERLNKKDNAIHNQINEKEMRAKWIFQKPEEMEELIKQYHLEDQTNNVQHGAILRKLNLCMIYIILYECNNYILTYRKRIHLHNFIYIEEIIKNGEIIYDKEKIEGLKHLNTNQTKQIQLKTQFEKMANIIKQEIGIKMKFGENNGFFELQRLTREKAKQMNFVEFMNKYFHFEELEKFFEQQNDQMNVKWFYHNEKQMEDFLIKENVNKKTKDEQYHVILSRINCCMIYLLITSGKEFTFQVDEIDTYQFIYIKSIHYKDQILFDVNETFSSIQNLQKGNVHYQKMFQLRKNQMKALSQLINKECQIAINFYDNNSDFQLLKLIDKNRNLINLNDFVDKYFQYEKVLEVLNKNKVNKVENIVVEKIENKENDIIQIIKDQIAERIMEKETNRSNNNAKLFPINYFRKRFDETENVENNKMNDIFDENNK